jgi:hypothetical protein
MIKVLQLCYKTILQEVRMDQIEKFYEYQQGKKVHCARVVPQIMKQLDLIDTLVAQGNSLRQIHAYLKETGQITSHYPYFWKVYKSLKSKQENQKHIKEPSEQRKQSKTSDVSFKPVTSIEDGLTPEELEEFTAQQNRMLNRQTAAKPTTKPAQEATSSNELPEILERRKQTGKGRKKQEKTG